MKTIYTAPKWVISWCNFRNKIKLPPTGLNRVTFHFCKFRLKFYALRYGGAGEHGIGYEWLGIRVQCGSTN